MTEKRYQVELTAKSLDAVRRALDIVAAQETDRYAQANDPDEMRRIRRRYTEARVARMEINSTLEIKEEA